MSKRCGVYVRQSEDRKAEGLSVERQQCECCRLAEARGWVVVEVYSDNDTSATKHKPRPAYNRMLDDIRSGRLDAVVCWDQDRLVRKPGELEDFMTMADAHKIDLANVNAQAVDLSTPQGRLFARQLGAFAAFEGEHKSQRQRLAFKQAAEAGKPHMGGRRPFGYRDDRVTVNHAEAVLVRDAAQRVLAGETTRSIVMEWNGNGCTHTTGGRWTVQALTTILKSARISGRREVRDADTTSKQLGTVVAVGCWEPIISVEDSDRLRAMLTGEARKAPARSPRAQYLLSGLLVCGRCDTPLVALNWKAGKTARYRCPAPGVNGRKSCGRLSIDMHRSDATVRNLLLEAIDSPTFRERLHQQAEVDPEVVQQVARDEQKLVDLAADYGNDDLTRAEWVTARDNVKARLEVNKGVLARATQTNALRGLEGDGVDLLARWEGLNLAQRRAVLAEVFAGVQVQGRSKGTLNTFDPTRLVPSYRF